jgi:hypothetical protein
MDVVAVQSLDPDMHLRFVSTMQTLVDTRLNDAELGAELLTASGLLALVLAVVGTCGVKSPMRPRVHRWTGNVPPVVPSNTPCRPTFRVGCISRVLPGQ